MKHFYKTLSFQTDQNNLLKIEPKLAPHVEDHDYFYIRDLTEDASGWVCESKIQNGFLVVQALHTTCVVGLNELDEPCLLGDINNFVREHFPKAKSYLHNSKLRTRNLCESDTKCDRNADAHMRSFLCGSPSQTVIVRNGKPLFGQWQRLCFIDYDGPRTRNVAIQIIGE